MRLAALLAAATLTACTAAPLGPPSVRLLADYPYDQRWDGRTVTIDGYLDIPTTHNRAAPPGFDYVGDSLGWFDDHENGSSGVRADFDVAPSEDLYMQHATVTGVVDLSCSREYNRVIDETRRRNPDAAEFSRATLPANCHDYVGLVLRHAVFAMDAPQ